VVLFDIFFQESLFQAKNSQKKMKRGSSEKFDSCEEFKKACGSQFRQYIAKTALASGVALNEQKISILQTSFREDQKCAGCEIPIDSCRGTKYCKYGCKQVVGCDWNFCRTREDVHTCVSCGKSGWCRRADLYLIEFCRKCKGAICGYDECYSGCKECGNDYCKKCAGEVTEMGFVAGFVVLLCNYHKERTECKICISEGKKDWGICKDIRCIRIKCSHTSTHTDYCQEHAADHK
jgi:hypothetical protein